MSFDATRAVWEYARRHPDDITNTEMLVLLNLTDHMNSRTRLCNPSFVTIAKETRLHPATVKRAMRGLMNLGLICRTQGGGRVSNRYVVMLELSHKTTAGVAENDSWSSTERQQQSHSDTGAVAESDTNQEVTKKEPAQSGSTVTASGAASPANRLGVVVEIDGAEQRRKAREAMDATALMLKKKWGTA